MYLTKGNFVPITISINLDPPSNVWNCFSDQWYSFYSPANFNCCFIGMFSDLQDLNRQLGHTAQH